jgi:type IX secretion system PorP/SprF family membrane protein
MKKLLVNITIAAAGLSGVVVAQQDPQFTQFMFNKLIYNPGYAGTSGAMCGVAQYRQQWVGFAGAPQSIALAGDMRLATLPLGVGFNVMSDKIGLLNTTFFRGAAALNLTRVGGGTLGIGLDIGFLQKKLNGDWIVPEPLKNDPRIPGKYGTLEQSNPDLNKISMDLGAGVFWQIPGKAYVGISSTHLPAQQLKDGELSFKVARHYYMMAGYTFQLNPWSKLTPNIMYKTDIAASAMDLNLTYLWSDMIWLGGSYRMYDMIPTILLGYQGTALQANKLAYKIGISYDLPSVGLKSYQKGSYELILGVCMAPTIKKATTHSSDRFLD